MIRPSRFFARVWRLDPAGGDERRPYGRGVWTLRPHIAICRTTAFSLELRGFVYEPERRRCNAAR
jgi:hypothetical protein